MEDLILPLNDQLRQQLKLPVEAHAIVVRVLPDEPEWAGNNGWVYKFKVKRVLYAKRQ